MCQYNTKVTEHSINLLNKYKIRSDLFITCSNKVRENHNVHALTGLLLLISCIIF